MINSIAQDEECFKRNRFKYIIPKQSCPSILHAVRCTVIFVQKKEGHKQLSQQYNTPEKPLQSLGYPSRDLISGFWRSVHPECTSGPQFSLKQPCSEGYSMQTFKASVCKVKPSQAVLTSLKNVVIWKQLNILHSSDLVQSFPFDPNKIVVLG